MRIRLPYNERKRGDKRRRLDKASQLLACLELPSDNVKCVRVRKIAIDFHMKNDDDCCK